MYRMTLLHTNACSSILYVQFRHIMLYIHPISIFNSLYTAKAIEKFDTGGKGYLTYDEFQGLIASFKLKFTPVQMSEVQ